MISSAGRRRMATESSVATVSRTEGMVLGLSPLSAWALQATVDAYGAAAIVIGLAVIPAVFFYRWGVRGITRLPFMPHRHERGDHER